MKSKALVDIGPGMESAPIPMRLESHKVARILDCIQVLDVEIRKFVDIGPELIHYELHEYSAGNNAAADAVPFL